jgi:hypothetical protein
VQKALSAADASNQQLAAKKVKAQGHIRELKQQLGRVQQQLGRMQQQRDRMRQQRDAAMVEMLSQEYRPIPLVALLREAVEREQQKHARAMGQKGTMRTMSSSTSSGCCSYSSSSRALRMS